MKSLLLLSCLLLTPALIHAQAKPLAQDYRIVFHNPNPERYVEGPGLVRLDDGSLLAVVPVVPREEWSAERRATQSRTHILRSSDGGQNWRTCRSCRITPPRRGFTRASCFSSRTRAARRCATMICCS